MNGSAGASAHCLGATGASEPPMAAQAGSALAAVAAPSRKVRFMGVELPSGCEERVRCGLPGHGTLVLR